MSQCCNIVSGEPILPGDEGIVLKLRNVSRRTIIVFLWDSLFVL
jgi:hypothetical protein